MPNVNAQTTAITKPIRTVFMCCSLRGGAALNHSRTRGSMDLSYNYTVLTVIGGIVVLLIWLAIVFARGGFWSVRTHLLRAGDPEHRPVSVCVVVPARNEAETIGRAVTALLNQT